MVNPHPKENESVNIIGGGLTRLAYFAARCPLPLHDTKRPDKSWEDLLKEDCDVRIEWARVMLHALWPVPGQNNSGSAL